MANPNSHMNPMAGGNGVMNPGQFTAQQQFSSKVNPNQAFMQQEMYGRSSYPGGGGGGGGFGGRSVSYYSYNCQFSICSKLRIFISPAFISFIIQQQKTEILLKKGKKCNLFL